MVYTPFTVFHTRKNFTDFSNPLRLFTEQGFPRLIRGFPLSKTKRQIAVVPSVGGNVARIFYPWRGIWFENRLRSYSPPCLDIIANYWARIPPVQFETNKGSLLCKIQMCLGSKCQKSHYSKSAFDIDSFHHTSRHGEGQSVDPEWRPKWLCRSKVDEGDSIHADRGSWVERGRLVYIGGWCTRKGGTACPFLSKAIDL